MSIRKIEKKNEDDIADKSLTKFSIVTAVFEGVNVHLTNLLICRVYIYIFDGCDFFCHIRPNSFQNI